MLYSSSYKDFLLLWTGWKTAQNSTIIAAQWLAWSTDKCIVSSYPGVVGFYNKGDVFDTSCQGDDQCFCFIENCKPWIYPDMPVHLENLAPLIEAKQQTFERLIEFIEHQVYGDPNFVWDLSTISTASQSTSAASST